MRISDWSSDVCSSDLAGMAGGTAPAPRHRAVHARHHRAQRRTARAGKIRSTGIAMSRRTLVVVFVLALTILLVATLPLRMVIATGAGDTFAATGLSAAEASGPAWSGHLRAVEWHGVAHGDVAVSLRPLSPLAGTRRVHLAARGFSVDLLQGRHTGFESASGQLDMPVRRPLAATVQLSLAGASLVFVDGQCHKAGGSVTAQLAGVLESPLQLEGTVSCDGRSEEHTSELQALMRISYAVFCLKKKKNSKQAQTLTHKTK